MMASLMQRRYSFPCLSPTFRSNQLWTPEYLNRITISNPHYHGYLNWSVQTLPPHLNAVSTRVAKYGDNGFFLQKDIPVEQLYDRTSLKRSDVRPWDEIVPKPLTSGSERVLLKESHLPFPSEHPYTSHISRFSIFPDTRRETVSQDVGYKEASSQTDYTATTAGFSILTAQKPIPCLVTEKAFPKGMRVECIPLLPPTAATSAVATDTSDLKTGIYRWDVSRSARRHQRSKTYPSPTTMFSPRFHGPHTSSMPLSPVTFSTLQTVNHQQATNTTYQEKYPAIMSPPDYSLSVTAKTESRGKFSRAPDFHHTCDKNVLPSNKSSLLLNRSLQPRETDDGLFVFPTPHNFHLPTNKEATEAMDSSCTEKEHVDGKVDKATQTDDGWDWLPAPQCCTSPIQEHPAHSHNQHLPPESQTQAHANQIQQENKLPLIDHFPRPPSAESTATHSSWMSEQSEQHGLPRLYSQPFSRSHAMKHFHSTYTEQAPDLRELSIRDGKKHMFNGFHAYYWH